MKFELQCISQLFDKNSQFSQIKFALKEPGNKKCMKRKKIISLNLAPANRVSKDKIPISFTEQFVISIIILIWIFK